MKKPNRKPRTFAFRLAAYDAVRDHCVNIETLAQLLQNSGPEALAFAAIEHTGAMLLDETDALREQLQKLKPRRGQSVKTVQAGLPNTRRRRLIRWSAKRS